MPEVNKEAFEMPRNNDTATLTPDLAAEGIQAEEGNKLKSVLAKLEGHAA